MEVEEIKKLDNYKMVMYISLNDTKDIFQDKLLKLLLGDEK